MSRLTPTSIATSTTATTTTENVGNLVCPALFDLVEAAKILIASPTEGEDKPLNEC